MISKLAYLPDAFYAMSVSDDILGSSVGLGYMRRRCVFDVHVFLVCTANMHSVLRSTLVHEKLLLVFLAAAELLRSRAIICICVCMTSVLTLWISTNASSENCTRKMPITTPQAAERAWTAYAETRLASLPELSRPTMASHPPTCLLSGRYGKSHVYAHMRTVLTNEDVGHGALAGLLLEVVLDGRTILDLVKPAGAARTIENQKGHDRTTCLLVDLGRDVGELGGEESLGALAVGAVGLGEDRNLVLRDGAL